ncbi:hypothetical protein Tco_1489357, partial [Tanacetum coccineum]
QVARAEEPPTSFDELLNTPIDLSAFVLNRLNIKDLTQEILVRPAFELLKGTYKSLIELENHLEECSKATTERLEWRFVGIKRLHDDLEVTTAKAVEKRFGGNAATKKTQGNLLKQHTSSTNRAVNTALGATTASTQATTVNSTTIDNLSDAVICAFFASQPNSP